MEFVLTLHFTHGTGRVLYLLQTAVYINPKLCFAELSNDSLDLIVDDDVLCFLPRDENILEPFDLEEWPTDIVKSGLVW